MQKIVIDTNIVISAFISPNGLPAKIIEFIVLNEEMKICYNVDILDEYEEVLSREKFDKYNFDPKEKEKFINKIIEIGILVDPRASDMPIPDESDRIFYDTAKESGAILITNNMKHYPTENFIMTPATFIQFIK
ncbi:MAG: putative toxin-antitoxin system toxin component, PIN family [Firmicutes bacterium]|nr:putative toxin-antitoxin system toxin component, PIN family [Bacillota bacterium]